MRRLLAIGLLVPVGCVTVGDVTVAPIPCMTRVWPTEFADLRPREPDDGVCVRAKFQSQQAGG